MNNNNLPENLTWNPVISNSGNIVRSARSGEKTFVEFKGGAIYESSEVSPELYGKFLDTHGSAENSTGTFYNKNLRPLNFTKVNA